MINLMYIVLTAMLALNVSSDVLDGFTQVHDSLNRSVGTVEASNAANYDKLAELYASNPEKSRRAYDNASELRASASGLCLLIDSLKLAIVQEVDGPKADVSDISNREDLEAASAVMLNPATLTGRVLRQQVESFRETVLPLIGDSARREAIARTLSTEPVDLPGIAARPSWEESRFEGQPVVAAVTLLTNLQNDVRYAEGEGLRALLASVDATDVRVNRMEAFVIPRSRFVMRGTDYAADIVLAAVDTTARPRLYIGDRQLDFDDNVYTFPVSGSGTFAYDGHLEVTHGDGSVSSHPFHSEYTVMEPSATVSATMMNVFYAGIDNPVSISVPGVANSSITATMTNGTLTRTSGGWSARPAKTGTDAVVTVTTEMDGRRIQVAAIPFKVRRLPDPTAYINIGGEGGATRYKGGRPVSKSTLAQAGELKAAIDDGVLDIEFKVTSFETVFFDSMGNAIPEVSDGNKFSRCQLDSFRRLQRGKRFYISRIKATGPDGTTRDLSPVEVIVN